jgi:hypothetical protein
MIHNYTFFSHFFQYEEIKSDVRQEGGFSPTTQSAMDWALEELLQGPEESMMIKHDDRATDYIDQLHEMLNKHHPTSEGS